MIEQSPSIVIVGGGTAGWLAAGILASKLAGPSPHGPKIVVLEPKGSSPIGVGEGTWPTMRGSLYHMGVNERDFLHACDASFKQGSKFIGWADGMDAYYHPFTPPKGFDAITATEVWGATTGISYADLASIQPAACEGFKAPKLAATADFQGNLNYGYHFDAVKVSDFLRRHCRDRLGVAHITATISDVRQDSRGYLTELRLDDGSALAGGLFVDCTGMNAVLIERVLGSRRLPCGNILLADTALAHPVSRLGSDEPIASATLSTATGAGWIWDIGLQSRRGVGHVYSSAHSDEDKAITTLLGYIRSSGHDANEGDVRKIPIAAGYRQMPWIKNCVALGLAMGFVEPLEASSIMMTELGAQLIASLLSFDRTEMAYAASQFNQRATMRWEEILDFIKLHYVLSRRDEPFWRDNRLPHTISDRLREWLTVWAHRPPAADDFYLAADTFPLESYNYVLNGMGHRATVPRWRKRLIPASDTQRYVDRARRLQAEVLPQFPTNRDLLGSSA